MKPEDLDRVLNEQVNRQRIVNRMDPGLAIVVGIICLGIAIAALWGGGS